PNFGIGIRWSRFGIPNLGTGVRWSSFSFASRIRPHGELLPHVRKAPGYLIEPFHRRYQHRHKYYMTSPDPAKNGSWLRQAKVKSIIRAAMPVLIAARCSTTTKHIAGISFHHCRPRVI
ncbi:MAG: hypothetical protein WBO12_09970, partial [Xanthobacteraceae bacterium]